MHFNEALSLEMQSAFDNQSIFAKVSANSLNRIFVTHDRIQSVRGIDGTYQLIEDPKTGNIYLKTSFKPFNLFITTEGGHTYNLFLTPIAIPAETVQINPLSPNKKLAENFEKNTPFIKAITLLMTGMLNGDAPIGYAIVPIKQAPHKLSRIFTIQLKTLFQGVHLQGQIWEIKNKVCRPIALVLPKFYFPGVRALALKSEVLPSCGVTMLYRVASL